MADAKRKNSVVLVIHMPDQGCFQNKVLTQEPKQKKGKQDFSPHNVKVKNKNQPFIPKAINKPKQ